MSEYAIQLNNITKLYRLYNSPIDRLKEILSDGRKSYGKSFYALKNINLTIRKGETIGIVGKNGAGKSTLLKIITEVLSPTEGEMYVEGKISALLELGAGFNPEYTGIENIYLNCSMIGMKNEEIEKKIPSILEFADIGDFVYQPVKSYSSGMFARLAFSVAVSTKPEILIVDEALSVGDTRFQIKCMEHMKNMMLGGTTVLFVSHDINAIRRFCQRAVWINSGQIQLDGEVNKVCDAYLDFLRCNDVSRQMFQKKVPDFIHKEGIAEVIDFKVKAAYGEVESEVSYDEPLRIEVTYDVYDEKLKDAVLGIALRSADDDYTCGLNTLLDHHKIPWKYGRNKMSLFFPYGLRATGGKYYFEVALEDQTASIGFHYIQRIKEINVTMNYTCEGRYNIPHTWEAIDAEI